MFAPLELARDRLSRKTLTGVNVVLTLICMILTLSAYVAEYGMFRFHEKADYGQPNSFTDIGFYRERSVVLGQSETTSKFNCFPDSSSHCEEGYAASARIAADSAVVFAILSFVISFSLIPLYSGLTLWLLVSAQFLMEMVYIVCSAIAYIRLRQYFQYSLNISEADIALLGHGCCWVAAMMTMCVAVMLTVVGPSLPESPGRPDFGKFRTFNIFPHD
jgi:hypothetical protein